MSLSMDQGWIELVGPQGIRGIRHNFNSKENLFGSIPTLARILTGTFLILFLVLISIYLNSLN